MTTDDDAGDDGPTPDEREAFYLDDVEPDPDFEPEPEAVTVDELRLAATQALVYGNTTRAAELNDAADRLERVERDYADLEAAAAWVPPVPATGTAPAGPSFKALEGLAKLSDDERAKVHRLLGTSSATGGDAIVDRFLKRTVDGAEIANLAPPTPLIAGFLDLESLAILYGSPASGKSLIALDWALSVASGSWWNGAEVRQGPVLYVCAEGVSGMGPRFKAWTTANRVHDAGLFRALHWLLAAPNLYDRAQADAFIAYATMLEPVLIVLDTFARCITGADENSAKETGFVVGNLERLKEATKATILAVHHTPKSGDGMRGSTALEGAADSGLEVKNVDGTVTLTPTKQKNSALGLERRFVIAGIDGTDSVALRPAAHAGAATELTLETMPSAFRKALRALTEIDTGDGVTWGLWEKAGVATSTLGRARKALLDLGLIEETKVGRSKKYSATEAGLAVL